MRVSPKVTCPRCKKEFDYDYADPPKISQPGIVEKRDSSGSAMPSGTSAGRKIVRRNIVCPYCHGMFGIDLEDF